MSVNRDTHKYEKGADAFETVIILIAFAVVASIFAFIILSTGSWSTEKGKHTLRAGLESVQSSINVKGSVMAEGSGSSVNNVTLTMSLADGGSPVNLSAADQEIVIGYKDQNQFANTMPWTIHWLVSKESPADDLLESGELAELTVDLTTATGGLTTPLKANTAFNLEIKPPKGAVLNINRTTPSFVEPVMDLN